MQELNSNSLTWKKGWGYTDLEALGIRDFPKEFVLRSHRTNDTRRMSVHHGDMEAHEFYDGEATSYISSCGRCRVRIWIGH